MFKIFNLQSKKLEDASPLNNKYNEDIDDEDMEYINEDMFIIEG